MLHLFQGLGYIKKNFSYLIKILVDFMCNRSEMINTRVSYLKTELIGWNKTPFHVKVVNWAI